ncbi:MAG: hypothetical protein JXB38_17735 [Anaerolineales bacterium]|nr:hypothetical protein [Anaerolineales bacterium]
MNTKLIGTWAFFIGMVLALVTAFVNLGGWVTQVLIVLGILAGFFHQKIKDEIVALGVIYLALAAVSGSMQELVAVGPYISAIVAAWVGFLGPVVLTALMIWGGAFLMANKNS